MATRSRGTPARTTRSPAPPPFAGSVLEDNDRTQSRRDSQRDGQTTDAQFSGDQTGSAANVTNTTLERREIPSFSDTREARIAEAAYWRAERRGFMPGQELDDWLEAERQIDAGQEEGEHRRDA